MSRPVPVISIIGLGLIGGSLGLAFRSSKLKVSVVGFDSAGVLRRAKKRGAIDVTAASLRAAVSNADMIFICTPVNTILRLLPKIARCAKRSAIVTDVGSVKGVVQECAEKLFGSGPTFVGGHPMAGSEGSGIDYADALLFQNAVYVLCPLKHSRRTSTALVALLKSIGARILVMDARRHDEAAAAISHLPQLLAVDLVDFAARKNKKNKALFQLAAGGFRDMTRIASSPFPLWEEILANNRAPLRSVLREYGAMIEESEKQLSSKLLYSLGRKFRRAKAFRDAIPKNSKGFHHSLHDLLISVDDKPGVLAKITSVLFRAGINISDIELLKVREGEGGTFRLSFDSAEASVSAAKALRAKGIRVSK